MWGKNQALDKKIEQFTVGNDYLLDKKLLKYDCYASIAHAKMLHEMNILAKKELNQCINCLDEIILMDKKKIFEIKQEDEDCHTAIENYLVKKLGKTGKKIHTFRSRNDQVQAALRLYYKDELNNVKFLANNLIKSMEKFKKKYGKIKLAGYTHTQKAMPSSIALWANAFIDSMQDNLELINLSIKLMDQNPLGSGAGYGLPIKINKQLTAKLLNFSKIQENPLYVQNSRGKFESTSLHSLTQVMLDLNKIASDLILFNLPELGYVELPDDFCTGSSIMPHKKNPDVLEILRAKYHTVLACEFEVKSIIGNLISGYNRDLQLTKEPTLKSIDIAKECLEIAILLFDNLKVNEKNCEKSLAEEIFSVEKTLKLVKKGIPFRDAYLKNK